MGEIQYSRNIPPEGINMLKRGINMTVKIERFMGTITQQLKDIETWVTKIESQTRLTNGKVAETVQKLALVKQAQDDCPARLGYGQPFERKNWLIGIGMFILAALNIIVLLKLNGG